LRTTGDLPKVGTTPLTPLTAEDLSEKSLADFKGKKIVLNIFPSVDTSTQPRRRESSTRSRPPSNVTIVCISADLPFAFALCAAEGIKNVSSLQPGMGWRDLRVLIGPLAG
jgi:thiol peroxidase